MTSDNVRSSLKRPTVLVVDPELAADSQLLGLLSQRAHESLVADSLEVARGIMVEREISFMVMELKFSDGDAFEFVREVASRHYGCRTIVHSRFCNVPVAVALSRLGVADILPKPTDFRYLLALLFDDDLASAHWSSFPAPKRLKRQHIRDVYFACGSNIARTAKLLSMHRRTLQKMIKKEPELMGSRPEGPIARL
ncbi:response regulator transcription factor [Rhizobium sp. WYJ-E13]|uniref:response regulator transcription factor n=1 Tax=Rhizobium sp. WYJ-E13 TaxID=2849093 RepID=UPI001C1F0F94|nr:helix-turn-helix domain-containing protein [Rhizobium sp. WYJ-E13]QWW72529.1 helix-turn-helix domain-containing protein [Rhizobium sp. WYJ-E13]